LHLPSDAQQSSKLNWKYFIQKSQCVDEISYEARGSKLKMEMLQINMPCSTPASRIRKRVAFQLTDKKLSEHLFSKLCNS
uniref:Uncharacterized protein n=1 Tax=Callorhinchus milii TaxID=7868 RepID=A0A4W3J082_CALMI